MRQRHVHELDFLKCVMIVLMVSFHLVYIGDSYPYAKQVVYTFHMPVFLIISGYLMNVKRSWNDFLRKIGWLALPYLLMEGGYVVMASILPIREHIDGLTPLLFLDKLFLHPLGPYWYLQVMVVCGLSYYAVFQLFRLSLLPKLIMLGLLFACYAWAGVIAQSASFYFLAGIAVRQSGVQFLRLFCPSWLALVPLVWLAANPANLHSNTIGGVLMVYLVVSFLLAVYPLVGGWLRQLMLFLGRNTLQLFLFSPLFTILCKPLVPVLSFDPSGMLFLVVSLAICLSGSLFVGWVLDKLRISPFLCGRRLY